MPALHADLEPRDGPNVEFKEHHDVTERKAGGKRVLSRLEQLLAGHYIKAEQSEAGRRFTNDYLKGCVGRGRSCLDIDPGGGGDGYPSETRLDASARFAAASRALESAKGPKLPGGSCADLLVKCCVEDEPFARIAKRAGIADEVVKSWIASLLTVLAGHYHAEDQIDGRSTTICNYQAALKRFEPEVK